MPEVDDIIDPNTPTYIQAAERTAPYHATDPVAATIAVVVAFRTNPAPPEKLAFDRVVECSLFDAQEDARFLRKPGALREEVEKVWVRFVEATKECRGQRKRVLLLNATFNSIEPGADPNHEMLWPKLVATDVDEVAGHPDLVRFTTPR